MDLAYLITPFFAWFVAGCSKFAINTIKARRLAFDQVGYGGMPSTHSAIVSAMAALIAFREGMSHPAFGVAVTLAFIVMLDASSLRRQIGRQAEAINALAQGRAESQLRERIGHTRPQIACGIAVGIAAAWLVTQVF